jgi:hypothetical protein
MTHYKHHLQFRQTGWGGLNAATDHKSMIKEVEYLIKDPNLGMQNLRFKITRVKKVKTNEYKVYIRGSRNALLRIIENWGYSQYYTLNGVRKVT